MGTIQTEFSAFLLELYWGCYPENHPWYRNQKLVNPGKEYNDDVAQSKKQHAEWLTKKGWTQEQFDEYVKRRKKEIKEERPRRAMELVKRGIV